MSKKNQTDMPEKTGKKKSSRKAAIAIGAVVGGLAAVYIGVGAYYTGHFAPNTVVNGVTAAGKTPAQVLDQIKKKSDGYSLTLTDEGDEEIGKITPEDIDLKVNLTEKDVALLLKKQSAFAWPKYYSKGQNLKNSELISYDSSKVDSILQALPCVSGPDIVQTQNAAVVYDPSSQKFTIQKEVYGNNVDLAELTDQVDSSLTQLKDRVDVSDFYEQPTVKSDDEKLVSMEKTLNDASKIQITYQVGGATEQIPHDTIASWLTTDENMNISYNRDAIASYVASMAGKYDTVGKPRSFRTHNGGTITVRTSKFGWKIDQAKEVDKLISELQAGQNVSRDFVYAMTAPSRDGNDWGSSYAEVNLTAQHLYLYKNGSLVLDTPVCTGNVSEGNGTPTGVYKVSGHQRDTILKGPTWRSPVKYWMPFNGGIGFHDASWRSNYGGQCYVRNGSHGCVNLPPAVAGTVFNTVTVGYPVIVYTQPGTETSCTNTQVQNAINAINAIGTVTADSGAKIQAARAAYNGLSASHKNDIPNYSRLTDAEAAYAPFASANAAEVARAQQEAQKAEQAAAEAQAEAASQGN